MKKFKKFISVILMIILIISNLSNITIASMPISEANMFEIGMCETGLRYYSNIHHQWFDVDCWFTLYEENGKRYPAYCLDPDNPGVGNIGPYTVDIDRVVDNEAIWRVVSNGYPYKSPQDLGVTTIEDAYLVTKRAVHSIISNVDVMNQYSTSNAHDVVVLNAINRLTNIGRYGAQTRASQYISINKQGEIYKEGNYYVQKFNVTGNVDISNYIITEASNLPTGTIITNASGVQTNQFNNAEYFYVKVPQESMLTNIESIIRVQGKCKTYPVFYGATRVSGSQNYALSYDPYGDLSTRGTFSVNVYQSGIVITKTDAETGQKLDGVTFNARYEDGTEIGDFTTNSEGKITITNLRPERVILREVSTKDEYILDTTPITVDLEYQQTKNIDLTNNHKKGNLKIIKVDKDNHNVALGNVEFDLYSDEFQRVIGTYTTDVNGEIQINNLRVGNYRLIEKKTGKWYNLSNDTNIEVKWNTTEENTIENELKKGQIRVIKVDLDNNEVKLECVKFDVLDEFGNIIETIVTDENGEALTRRLPIRDYQNITLREKETLQNYVLTEDTQTVTLEENQIKNITFQNEKKKGQIRVIKVDSDNNEVKLKNVKFDIINENEDVVDTIITDENGEAVTKMLPIDSEYTIVEKETDRKYKLTEETKTITLEENEIKDITFENEKRKGQLKIIKVDKDNNEVLLEGVKFDILNEDGEIVDTVITNVQGEAVTKMLPCIDTEYTVIERETKREYVLTEETKTIELTEDEITSIKFENEKIKGKVEITKISADDNKLTGETKGTLLENAVFEIYDLNDEIVDTITISENGKGISKLLEYGDYYIKEKYSGSDYYLLNTEKYKIEIKENNEIIPITIENTSVDIGLDIDKNGIIQAQPNDEIKYSFDTLKNTSNVALDNFTWTDNLPYEYVKIAKLFTGTYNEDLDYAVKYKTNKSEKYIEYGKYNTQKNNYIDFTKIKLAEDEIITDYKVEFGTVIPGFEAIEKPFIFAKVLPTVKAEDKWINYTSLTGNYKEHELEDKAEWPTISYSKKLEVKKLPRTGY